MSSLTKLRLNRQKAVQEHTVSFNSYMGGIDRLNMISAGLIPATPEEVEDAREWLARVDDHYHVEKRKADKREAKKLAKKSKVVRGGRP